MRLSLSGFGFLASYIVMVGVASFLEKFSMKQLNPYQVNFLMAIGMAVTAIPALWIKQGSLTNERHFQRLSRDIDSVAGQLISAGRL